MAELYDRPPTAAPYRSRVRFLDDDAGTGSPALTGDLADRSTSSWSRLGRT